MPVSACLWHRSFWLRECLAPAQQPNNPCRGFIGIVAAVIAPIFCGVRGFVCGAIGGLPYNLFARTVGGLELELEPKPNIPVAP